ncbi:MULTISPECIES: class I SAM-dependent methyltransferase [Metabacillus]|uniref:Class I SAM-dependent methyltransferase n=1 Tax=Metabacillus rhizolycopersici TaxID=2875709 RepID=A0ABS7UPF7_9BACI|nr:MULTISPECIES: class I SAM-dependent methyltransferase [Metabacillus]MBZ5749967.1 class I SAM-dependent methyltransferase [Metabacillus rhizolycopersici]MCM3654568.1 class I SAM-dependent methyltransferase [Metabacillus litoralis]
MDIKKDVQKQFGRSADAYVKSKGHSKGADLKKLVEMACPTGREEVLDVATGGGHTANALAPLVQKVTALDLTPEMLAAAERFIKGNGHANVVFVAGDAEKLPFPDETFDIVTCRIAPHHFPNVEHFIREAYRVLKAGGQFLVDDNVAPEDDEFDHFYNEIEKMRDYSHYRAWKKTEWLQMLELNGFETQQLYRFEKRFEFESWCDRMHLSDIEKTALNELIVKASEKVKHKFRIQLNDTQVVSFLGEAMLLQATKL